MAKARLYKKANEIRFNLYGKTHFIASVNQRGEDTLTSYLGQDVHIIIDFPDYVNDSKAMIGGVACHVEHAVSPFWDKPDVVLTEPTAMTFELLYTSKEHDEFPLPDGSLVFDDRGLKIYCHYGLRRRFEYRDAVLDIRSDVDKRDVFHLVKDVHKGSVLSMMALVEDSGLEWNSLQERIERTEDFAISYMEDFSEYVISTYVNGTPF